MKVHPNEQHHGLRIKSQRCWVKEPRNSENETKSATTIAALFFLRPSPPLICLHRLPSTSTNFSFHVLAIDLNLLPLANTVVDIYLRRLPRASANFHQDPRAYVCVLWTYVHIHNNLPRASICFHRLPSIPTGFHRLPPAFPCTC